MCIAGDNPTWQCNPREHLVFSLRGNEWRIEGRDCRHEVKALTVFGLDHWTRQKGKSKGLIERKKGKDKKSRI